MNVGPTQAAALGKFAPKGFISLRDAIEQIGSKLVSGWTGDEQVDAQSASVRRERDNWLADQIGQVCVEKWGNTFIQAASDYANSWVDRLSGAADQPGTARQPNWTASGFSLALDAVLHSNEREFEKLQAQCGDRSTALSLRDIRIAARRILEDARRVRTERKPLSELERGLLGPTVSSTPPMMDSGSGPKPIKFPAEVLDELEVKADKIFQEREQAQATIRQRVVKVWEMLRPELHAGSITCIILKEGKTVAINPALWATNDAEVLFRECEYDKREILVGEDDLDDHKTPKKRRYSRAKAEREYQARVKNWPADERPPSRLDDESWLKKEFGVPRDKAREIRKKHAPPEWQKSGAPKSGGK